MRLLARSAAVLLLVTTSAHAQTALLRDQAPTRGVNLPPTGAALLDDARALNLNPAGIGFMQHPELFYLHERNLSADGIGDALFAADGFFGTVGLGLGVQWIRQRGLPSYRKTTLGLAIGSEDLSLGLGYNLFASQAGGELDRLSTFDAGLTMRPSRYISVGASVRDLEGSRLDGQRLPRRMDLGLGLQPLRRVRLAADLLADDVGRLDNASLSYAAILEPIDGIALQLGFSHRLREGAPAAPDLPATGRLPMVQLALTLDSRSFGLTYAAGARSNDLTSADHLVQARLSAADYPSLNIGAKPYAILDLKELTKKPERSLISISTRSARDPYLNALEALKTLKETDEVSGVVLKISELEDIGHGRVQELRDALLEVKQSGKKLVAMVLDAGDDEYLLATAADKIYAVPQATLLINGYSASPMFFGETLEKLGVTVDVARVGAYKNAPDELSRKDMSPEQKEVLDRFLDGLFTDYVKTVAAARKIPEEKFRATLDQGLLTPADAKKAGLIDEVVYPDELAEALDKDAGGHVDLVTEIAGDVRAQRRWSGRPRIALIVVEGNIADGKSRQDPFGAVRVAGAESIVKALEQAYRDDDVAAVLLRVDSPGGSGSASDLIWRALKKVGEKKPVIASMGDYAASGGYYIAMAAEQIVAEPATLTGSIGVFAVKPNFGPLLTKLGVHSEVLRRGERADFFNLTRPWTEGELKAMQAYIDAFYDDFITKVGESRKLDKAKVDSIARGRVWSGAAARDIGLVDQLGGLADALRLAKKKAGFADRSEVDLVLYDGEDKLEGLPEFNGEAALSPELRAVIGQLSALTGFVMTDLPDGPLAMLPYRMKVK